MNRALHPFTTLRRKIRAAASQYRDEMDNSESLFHPDHGFIYAYDMQAVEEALNEYEATLPTPVAVEAQVNRGPIETSIFLVTPQIQEK